MQVGDMNRAKLIEIAATEWSCYRDEADAAISFHEAIITRLETILTEPLDEWAANALMHILTGEKITFRDGFVINGDTMDEHLMGISDAAIVVSAMSSFPDRPWTDWKSAYSGGMDTDFESCKRYHSTLLHQIRSHPAVLSVEP